MLVLMNMEINIIKVKKMNVGLFIQKILKLLKLHLIGIYGCITQLTKFQMKSDKKYSWQKKHLENQTGTRNSFKPVKIRKNRNKKEI